MKLRKLTALLIAAALLLTLAGCAQDAKKSPAETAESFVGESAEELISAIGEPENREYQSSCEIAGAQDGFLDYDGFTVVTLKTADGETVQRVDKA